MSYWTDFLTAQLHPASVWQLPGVFHGSSDFNGYGLGRVLDSSGQTQEEVAERVRSFAEECDSLQVAPISDTSSTVFHLSSELGFWYEVLCLTGLR